MAINKKAAGRGKNLKRVDNTIINQYGVQISEEEARYFRNLTQNVNRKRNRLIKDFEGKPLYYGSQVLPEDRTQLQLMGEELDLAIRKRSAALNTFQSRKQFEAAIRSRENVMKTDYEEWRLNIYKQNFINVIKEMYGNYSDLVDPIIDKLQNMPYEQYRELVGSDRVFNIKTHYELKGALDRINAMREKLGLNTPDYDEGELEEGDEDVW